MRQWLLKRFPADTAPLLSSPPMRLGEPTPKGTELAPVPSWVAWAIIAATVLCGPIFLLEMAHLSMVDRLF